MKKRCLILFIYLSGCIVNYPIAKYAVQHDVPNYEHWTVGDRAFVIGFSVLSWVGVIASTGFVIFNSTDFSARAKW